MVGCLYAIIYRWTNGGRKEEEKYEQVDENMSILDTYPDEWMNG